MGVAHPLATFRLLLIRRQHPTAFNGLRKQGIRGRPEPTARFWRHPVRSILSTAHKNPRPRHRRNRSRGRQLGFSIHSGNQIVGEGAGNVTATALLDTRGQVGLGGWRYTIEPAPLGTKHDMHCCNGDACCRLAPTRVGGVASTAPQCQSRLLGR